MVLGILQILVEQMETGTIGIDGEVYTFSDSGAMINDKK